MGPLQCLTVGEFYIAACTIMLIACAPHALGLATHCTSRLINGTNEKCALDCNVCSVIDEARHWATSLFGLSLSLNFGLSTYLSQKVK